VIRLLASAFVAAATAEETRELPIPPWAFGLIAVGVFAALLAVTFAFRNTGTKHGAPSEGH
jgi:hypothetical protein